MRNECLYLTVSVRVSSSSSSLSSSSSSSVCVYQCLSVSLLFIAAGCQCLSVLSVLSVLSSSSFSPLSPFSRHAPSADVAVPPGRARPWPPALSDYCRAAHARRRRRAVVAAAVVGVSGVGIPDAGDDALQHIVEVRSVNVHGPDQCIWICSCFRISVAPKTRPAPSSLTFRLYTDKIW